MLNSTLDILYLVLAIGFGALLIALTILVFHCIQSVKRTNRIMEIVEDSADTVNEYIQLPANLGAMAMEWVKHADFMKYYDWFKNRGKAKQTPVSETRETRKQKKKRRR